MTAIETIIHYGNLQYGKNKDVPVETFANDPDMKFIIDAMEVFGKQEYNQALDNVLKEFDVCDTRLEEHQRGKILKLKKL